MKPPRAVPSHHKEGRLLPMARSPLDSPAPTCSMSCLLQQTTQPARHLRTRQQPHHSGRHLRPLVQRVQEQGSPRAPMEQPIFSQHGGADLSDPETQKLGGK